MLLPHGVQFDPNREDNPEIYLAVINREYDPQKEQQSVRELASEFLQSGVPMIRYGERATFQARGRSGSIYTWEFRHPRSGEPLRFAST